MSYISRDAANEALRECVRAYPNSFYNGIEVARTAIRKMPASDVAPVVHGRWVDDKGNAVPWDEENPECPSGSCYCSVCLDWLAASDEYPVIGKYCPNCGAKMDLEAEE